MITRPTSSSRRLTRSAASSKGNSPGLEAGAGESWMVTYADTGAVRRGRQLRAGESRPSVRAEAVEQPRPTGGDEVALATSTRWMHRIPRRIAAAGPVVVAHHRAPGRCVARPVAAVRVGGAGERPPLGVGTGEHVVHVRRVAHAVDLLSLLRQRVH